MADMHERRTLRKRRHQDESDLSGAMSRPSARRRTTGSATVQSDVESCSDVTEIQVGRRKRQNCSLLLEQTQICEISPTDNPVSSKRKRKQRSEAQVETEYTQGDNGSDDNNSTSSERSYQRTSLARFTPTLVTHNENDIVPRCGKILKINLKNFMCHSNLSIDFHNRINFLVGSNGSGKSALMAALVLGLGGSAKKTNRSGSLKQLIKTGMTSSKIEITIANDGPDPYQYDVYGDYITVVRSINQNGSTYSLRDATGQHVSKKLDDLQRMLVFHNIQVDNPVFVLNQDSAREFLKTLEPKSNYKLFTQATQLDLIDEKLKECRQLSTETAERINGNKIQLDKDKCEINELQAKLSQLISLAQFKRLLAERQCERLWIQVIDLEKVLEEHSEKLAMAVERKMSLIASVENRNGVEQEYKEKLLSLANESENKKRDYRLQNSVVYDVQQELNDKKTREANLKSSLQTMINKKSQYEKEINDFNEHFNETAETSTRIEEDRKSREIQIENLQREKNEKSAIIESAKRDLQIFLDSNNQNSDKLHELKDMKIEENHNIDRVNRNIEQIQRSAKNTLSLYGEHMAQLVADVNDLYKKKKFSELPRGPLGRYVEVSNNKYRSIVERQIFGLLGAFIVSNREDRLVLEKLLQRKYPNMHPVIITTRFMKKMYDVSRGQVQAPRGTLLLLNLIKCNDPVVMNCLIDRAQIETILIADNKRLAEHITAHEENVPQNLSKVIVTDPCLEYFPTPKYRLYTMSPRPVCFIQVNVKERIDQLLTERKEYVNKLQRHDEEIQMLQAKLQENQGLMKQKQGLIQKHEACLRQIDKKLSDLEDVFSTTSSEMALLDREMARAKGKLAEVIAQIGTKELELAEVSEERERLEERLQEEQSHLVKQQKSLDETSAQIDEIKNKIRSLDDNCSRNKCKLEKIETIIKALEDQKLNAEVAIKLAERDAQAKGDRVQPERSAAELDEEIGKLKAKVKQRIKINDDPDKLKDTINDKQMKYDYSKNFHHQVQAEANNLKKSVGERIKRLILLRNAMAVLVNWQFDHVLSIRNFDGKVEFDHEAKTLNLAVIPRKSENQNLRDTVSNAKSLSGGERSYTTVAFLMALWACVDHPFFFLDEYDVFTDEVNRSVLTNLLIKEGRSRPHRQYTFLTPQDLQVETDKDIRIFRLSEPERQ